MLQYQDRFRFRARARARTGVAGLPLDHCIDPFRVEERRGLALLLVACAGHGSVMEVSCECCGSVMEVSWHGVIVEATQKWKGCVTEVSWMWHGSVMKESWKRHGRVAEMARKWHRNVTEVSQEVLSLKYPGRVVEGSWKCHGMMRSFSRLPVAHAGHTLYVAPRSYVQCDEITWTISHNLPSSYVQSAQTRCTIRQDNTCNPPR